MNDNETLVSIQGSFHFRSTLICSPMSGVETVYTVYVLSTHIGASLFP
jgi:hypothetical protein